jgi:hypothetical protein
MAETAGLTPGNPLQGAAIAGRWTFGYDMPDELGGGFVCGELLLRSDGVLFRPLPWQHVQGGAVHLELQALGSGQLVGR